MRKLLHAWRHLQNKDIAASDFLALYSTLSQNLEFQAEVWSPFDKRSSCWDFTNVKKGFQYLVTMEVRQYDGKVAKSNDIS